jgi:type I restriction enzyme S subunit
MVETETKMQRYDKYVDSGVEWLGEIPESWSTLPIRAIFEERNEKNDGPKTDFILSVTKYRGVIPYDEKGAIGNNKSEDIERYKLVYPNDFVINKMNVVIGSLGMSKYFGAFSLVYLVYKPKTKDINMNYYSYLFSNPSFYKSLIRYCKGIMELRESLDKNDFKKLVLPFPKLSIQTRIVVFLDDKTTKIDEAIAIKEQQINLLKERKQILIHKAVTQGLNPNVKLKDSGVEWIGEIPEHWEVKRLKNVCFINRNSLPETTNKDFKFKYVDIGSVSLEEGITEAEEFTFKNSPSRARRIAKPGDTVISTVRTYLKAIDFVNEEKSIYIYSTGFAVLEPELLIYPEFLANFVRSDAFTEQVTINSKGMSYPAINSTDLSRLFVVHPNTSEQKEISGYIETGSQKIETAISLKQQEIAKLKEYKSSLINGVVTGKVKVC